MGRRVQVLAAAASNVAVDNLVERLTAADPKLVVVRVGHPARLLPQVQHLTGTGSAPVGETRVLGAHVSAVRHPLSKMSGASCHVRRTHHLCHLQQTLVTTALFLLKGLRPGAVVVPGAWRQPGGPCGGL